MTSLEQLNYCNKVMDVTNTMLAGLLDFPIGSIEQNTNKQRVFSLYVLICNLENDNLKLGSYLDLLLEYNIDGNSLLFYIIEDYTNPKLLEYNKFREYMWGQL